MPIQLTSLQFIELTTTEGEIYQLGEDYTWSMRLSIFMSYNTTLIADYGPVFPEFKYILNPNEVMTIKGTLVAPNLSLPSYQVQYPEDESIIETYEEVETSILTRIASTVKSQFVWNPVSQTPYNAQFNFFFSTKEDYDNVSNMIYTLENSLTGQSFI